MHSDQEKRIVQYLLGQLPEQDQTELEREYLADDALFDELLAIEDDLRDAYARGELSVEDRTAFEQTLLAAPQQKEKQEFAGSLLQRLSKSHVHSFSNPGMLARGRSLFRTFIEPRRMVLIPVVSLALVLLIAGSWWLGHRRAQPVQSSNAPGATQPPARPEAPVGATSQSQGPETKTLALVLTPGSVRSTEGELNSLVIPADVTQVRLEARFKGEYQRYQAVIETPEGQRTWSQGNMAADEFAGGKRVVLNLPSKLLLPNDYILTVHGLPASGNPETVAEYTFRVTKK
jgi:anti-sigma factor RsiW